MNESHSKPCQSTHPVLLSPITPAVSPMSKDSAMSLRQKFKNQNVDPVEVVMGPGPFCMNRVVRSNTQMQKPSSGL
jgi:hypothetical protein